MYNPFNRLNNEEGFIKVLTPYDVMDKIKTEADTSTDLDDIDDDFTGSLTIGEPEYIELPKRDFNIRTLTQKHLESMRQPDTWGYKL